MLDKLNAFLDKVKGIASRLLNVVIPVIGVLIASDLLLGTKFGLIKRAASMAKSDASDIVLGVVIVYLIIKKV